jgi:hypothetical protein
MVEEVNDWRRRKCKTSINGCFCLTCRLALMRELGRCEFESETHCIVESGHRSLFYGDFYIVYSNEYWLNK